MLRCNNKEIIWLILQETSSCWFEMNLRWQFGNMSKTDTSSTSAALARVHRRKQRIMESIVHFRSFKTRQTTVSIFKKLLILVERN